MKIDWAEVFDGRFQQFTQHLKNKETLTWILGGLAIASLLTVFNFSMNSPDQKPTQDTRELATFIPAGTTLVPLQLVNPESLNSFLGSHGVVDLYSTYKGDKKRRAMAAVRVIQSPINPLEYAALIPDHINIQVLSTSGPLLAVIRREDKTGTKIVDKPRKAKTSRVLEESL